jgi:hypothetical protein
MGPAQPSHPIQLAKPLLRALPLASFRGVSRDLSQERGVDQSCDRDQTDLDSIVPLGTVRKERRIVAAPKRGEANLPRVVGAPPMAQDTLAGHTLHGRATDLPCLVPLRALSEGRLITHPPHGCFPDLPIAILDGQASEQTAILRSKHGVAADVPIGVLLREPREEGRVFELTHGGRPNPRLWIAGRCGAERAGVPQRADRERARVGVRRAEGKLGDEPRAAKALECGSANVRVGVVLCDSRENQTVLDARDRESAHLGERRFPSHLRDALGIVDLLERRGAHGYVLTARQLDEATRVIDALDSDPAHDFGRAGASDLEERLGIVNGLDGILGDHDIPRRTRDLHERGTVVDLVEGQERDRAKSRAACNLREVRRMGKLRDRNPARLEIGSRDRLLDPWAVLGSRFAHATEKTTPRMAQDETRRVDLRVTPGTSRD